MLSDHTLGKKGPTKRSIYDYARQLHDVAMGEYERRNPGKNSVQPRWIMKNGKWQIAEEYLGVPARFLDLSNKPKNDGDVEFGRSFAHSRSNSDDVATNAGFTDEQEMLDWMDKNRNPPRIKDFIPAAQKHMNSVFKNSGPQQLESEFPETPAPETARDVAMQSINIPQVDSQSKSIALLTPRDIAIASMRNQGSVSSPQEARKRFLATGKDNVYTINGVDYNYIDTAPTYTPVPVPQQYIAGNKLKLKVPEGQTPGLKELAQARGEDVPDNTRYSAQYRILDMYRNTPAKSVYTPGARDNYNQMRSSGEETAKSLLGSGPAQAGYFVLTDQQRAAVRRVNAGFKKGTPEYDANRLMGTDAVDNAIYHVRAIKLDGGRYGITAVPQGFPRAIQRAGTYNQVLDESAAEQVLGSFRGINTGQTFANLGKPSGKYKFITADRITSAVDADFSKLFPFGGDWNTAYYEIIRRKAAERARVGAGSKILNSILKHNVAIQGLNDLRNPDKFYNVITGRKVPGVGDQHKAGVRSYLASHRDLNSHAGFSGARELRDSFMEVLAPSLRNGTKGNANQAGRDAYAKALRTTRRLRDQLKKKRITLTEEESKDLLGFVWGEVAGPAMQSIQNEVNLPFVTSQIGGYKVISGLYREKMASAFSQRASILTKNAGYESSLEKMIMEYKALRRGNNGPESLASFIKNASTNDTWISSRLEMLDAQERALPDGPFKIMAGLGKNKQQLTTNRLDVYKRLKYRINQMMEYKLGEHFGGRHHPTMIEDPITGETRVAKYADHFQAHYQFQEAVPGKTGYGIRISIARRGKPIRAGATDAYQTFIPIQDLEGKFTNESGSNRFQGRFVAFSDELLKNAAVAQWDTGLSWITHGIEPMARMGIGTRLSAAGKGVTVMSATVAMMGGYSNALKSIFQEIGKDNYTEANRRGSSAIAGVIEEKIGEASPRNYAEMSNFELRSSILMMTDDPLKFQMNTRDIDRQKLTDYVSLSDKDFEESIAGLRKTAPEVADRIVHEVRMPWRKKAIEHGYTETKKIAQFFSQSLGMSRSQREEISLANRISYLPALGNFLGTKAGNDLKPMSPATFAAFMPFGWPEERPVQNMKPIRLGNLDKTRLTELESPLKVRGYEEFSDPMYRRNISAGFIIGAEEIDEHGNPVLDEHGLPITMNDDQAMRAMGYYEQQALIKQEAVERIIGPNANVQGQKSMLGASKNTLQMAGKYGATTWEGGPDIFTGVGLEKTLGKHNSYSTVALGWMQRAMAEANESNKETIRDKINSLLGENSVEITQNGLLRGTVPHGFRAPGMKDMRDLAQIAGFNIYDSIIMQAGGKRLRIKYTQGVQPFSISETHSPTTDMSTREQVYLGRFASDDPLNRVGFLRPRMRPNINSISSNANNILRLRSEGFFAQADQMLSAGLSSAVKRGVFYSATQYAAALAGSYHGSAIDDFNIPITEVGLEDMYAAGRQNPIANNALTREAALKRYGNGQGLRKLIGLPETPDLPTEYTEFVDSEGNTKRVGVSHLFIPDERRIDNIPSKTEKAVDRIIYELDKSQGHASPDYLRAIEGYHRTLTKEFTGKTGALSVAVKEFDLSGIGMVKSGIQQNMWGEFSEANPRGMKPFEVRVGPQLAEMWGMIPPNDLTGRFSPKISGNKKEVKKIWAEIEKTKSSHPLGFASVYAVGGRSPIITAGRQGFHVTVDPDVDGAQMYYHESLNRIQFADSDGDQAAMTMIGMVNGSPHSLEQFKIGQEAAAQIVQQKMIDYSKYAEVIQSSDKPAPVINSPEDFENYVEGLRKTSGGRTIKDLTDIVRQRDTGNHIGMVGATTNPIESYLIQRQLGIMDQMTTTSDPDKLRMLRSQHQMLNIAQNETGWFQENPIKVKAGTKFSMGPMIDAIMGNSRMEEMDLGITGGFNPKTATIPQPADIHAYITDNFITPKLKDVNNKKAIQQAYSASIFRDFLVGHAADAHTAYAALEPAARKDASRPEKWYRQLFKEPYDILSGAMGYNAPNITKEAAAAHEFLTTFHVDKESPKGSILGASEYMVSLLRDVVSGKPLQHNYADGVNPLGVIYPDVERERIRRAEKNGMGAAFAAAQEAQLESPARYGQGLQLRGVGGLVSDVLEDTKYNKYFKSIAMNNFRNAYSAMTTGRTIGRGLPSAKSANAEDVADGRLTRLSDAFELEKINPSSYVPRDKPEENFQMKDEYFRRPVPEPTSIPEPQELKPAVMAALDLVETPLPEKAEIPLSQRIEEKVMAAAQTASRTTSHSSSIWGAVAGLAAGSTLIWASMQGDKERDQPPGIPMNGRETPRSRVMDGNFGGSHDSYNIQVRAKDSRSRNSDEYGMMASMASPGGNSTVQLRDNRKDIQDQMNQQFSSSMKGR